MWLGAALQATTQLPFGTAVTSALHRYHPVLLAQVFATLEVMYPGRVFLGIGSGESLNESPFGGEWPSPRGQLEALEEALVLLLRLFDGERIDHSGRFFRNESRLSPYAPVSETAHLCGRVWPEGGSVGRTLRGRPSDCRRPRSSSQDKGPVA